MLLVVSLISLAAFLQRYNCKIANWFVVKWGKEEEYGVNFTLGEPESNDYDTRIFEHCSKNNGTYVNSYCTTYFYEKQVWFSFRGFKMNKNEDQNLEFTKKESGDIGKLQIPSSALGKSILSRRDKKDNIITVKYSSMDETMILEFETSEKTHQIIEKIDIGLKGPSQFFGFKDFYVDSGKKNIIINLPPAVVALLDVDEEFSLYYKLIDEIGCRCSIGKFLPVEILG